MRKKLQKLQKGRNEDDSVGLKIDIRKIRRKFREITKKTATIFEKSTQGGGPKQDDEFRGIGNANYQN